MKKIFILVMTLFLMACEDDHRDRPIKTQPIVVQQEMEETMSYWWDYYIFEKDGDVRFYRGGYYLELDWDDNDIEGDVYAFNNREINQAWRYAKTELGGISAIKNMLYEGFDYKKKRKRKKVIVEKVKIIEKVKVVEKVKVIEKVKGKTPTNPTKPGKVEKTKVAAKPTTKKVPTNKVIKLTKTPTVATKSNTINLTKPKPKTIKKKPIKKKIKKKAPKKKKKKKRKNS